MLRTFSSTNAISSSITLTQSETQTPSLFDEIWKLIFLKLNYKDFQKCTLVDKKWNQLTSDPILTKKMIYEGFCMNPSEWNKYCGEGNLFSDENDKAYKLLPLHIDKILKSPCPAFSEKRIIDTHMLVWIPNVMKGQLLTINNFGKLLQEQPEFSDAKFFNNGTGYRNIWPEIVQQEGDKLINPGWVLMTTALIPKSQNKSITEQHILVEKLNKIQNLTYRVPKASEAIICMIADYLKTKKTNFLFDFNCGLGLFTACQETVQVNNINSQIIVGAISSHGIFINYSEYPIPLIGTAALSEL